MSGAKKALKVLRFAYVNLSLCIATSCLIHIYHVRIKSIKACQPTIVLLPWSTFHSPPCQLRSLGIHVTMPSYPRFGGWPILLPVFFHYNDPALMGATLWWLVAISARSHVLNGTVPTVEWDVEDLQNHKDQMSKNQPIMQTNAVLCDPNIAKIA